MDARLIIECASGVSTSTQEKSGLTVIQYEIDEYPIRD